MHDMAHEFTSKKISPWGGLKFFQQTYERIDAPFNHVRVTPNVYTTTQELDRLVQGIHSIIKS